MNHVIGNPRYLGFCSAVSLALIATIVLPGHASACQCLGDQSQIEVSPVVFRAQVLEAREEQRWTLTKYYEVKFSIPEVWKGKVDPVMRAYTVEARGGNCGGGPVFAREELHLAMRLTPIGVDGLPRFDFCNMVRRESVEYALGESRFTGRVCPRASAQIPARVLARAQRSPHEFGVWGQVSGPPFYGWHTWLGLENPNRGYHPVFNSAAWKSGCR